MRNFLLFIVFSALFISCGNSDSKSVSPGEMFIQSLKENKFEVLETLLPTRDVYKAVSTAKEEKSDASIDSFLMQNKERFKGDWAMITQTIKSKSIDLSKLKIKDWLIYDPFKNENKNVQAGVLVYEYEGKTWDDIMILVAQVTGKTYLLQLPNPTRAFSFQDSTLRNVTDAKMYKELADTSFRKKVQEKVKELIGYAKENKTEQLTSNVLYNGDDESRRWKSALNPSDVKEFERAGELIKQINSIMESCTVAATFESFDYERESEGVWLVQKMKCGNKNIFFAFLQVNGKLLLGEVNADESPGE